MKSKKHIIALILFIFSGLFAGAQNKFLITNLKIEHSTNKDGNIDARITFTYKQTEGYVDKVTPRLAVDGNAISSSYQGGFNGGALRLESNGVLNLRTGMEEMPKDLSTNTLISKLSDGQHTLSVKFDGYTSTSSNKFIAIDSNVASVNFVVGKSGQTATPPPPPPPANNVTTDNFTVVETNSATGTPFSGVVADGFSSLKIEINTNSTASLCNFNIGNSQGGIYSAPMSNTGGGQQYVNRVNLSGGKAVVYYYPPKYISDASLLDQRKAFKASSNGSIYGLNVPIAFSFIDSNGKEQSQTINLQVYRPPVMFVHGFTGSKETWIVLRNELLSKKFDAYADDYYQYDDGGYQTIDAQSMLLGEIIASRKAEYAKQGIKIQKLDVICHSMGGLFARNYVHNFPTYGNDVRKLIMLATPNHGIEWWNMKRQLFGAIAALGMGQHLALAAEVKSSSPKIRSMNAGEKQGTHLNYDVQYGNIFVSTDDLVVSGTSARLSGVTNYPLTQKAMHSVIPQFDFGVLNPFGENWLNVAITEFTPAIARVLQWLTHEMETPVSYNDEIKLVEGSGKIMFGTADANGNYLMSQIISYPAEIDTYTPVITGTDTKKVTIKFTSNGTEWAKMLVAPNTELFFRNFSPYRTDVNIKRGKARFISESKDGKFDVIVSPFKDGKEFYSSTKDITFYPRASIKDFDTDFTIEVDEQNIKVSSVSGRVMVENGNDAQSQRINSKEALVVDSYKNIQKSAFNMAEINRIWNDVATDSNSLFANVRLGGTLANGRSASGNQNNAGSNNQGNQSGNPQNCLNQLQVQFIQKVGATADPQGRMIMMKLDDENKRELSWFNQAKSNYQQGVSPREMAGTYRKQQNPSVFSREYFSETVTIFEPMKIANTTGNSHGFMLMKDSREFKRFNSNQEAEGVILPCGSYKVYPTDDIPFATTKFQLIKN